MKTLILAGLAVCSAFAQTAAYPGSLTTDAQLGVPVNNISTSLTAQMTANGTSMTVADGTGIIANTILSIGRETVWVCGVSGNTVNLGKSSCPNVDGRGFNGTTAAIHPTNAAVKGYADSWYWKALAAEVKATQATLGPNLGNVGNNGVFVQSGTGALTRTAQNKSREFVSASDFVTTASSGTNNTATLQAAIDATPDGGALLLNAGSTYAVCSLNLTGKSITIYSFTASGTTIVRHSSCLNQISPIFRGTNSAAITLRDLYIDQLGNNAGSGFSNAASCIYFSTVGTVHIDHVFVNHCQADGFLIVGASDVTVTNSKVYQAWWNGFAISGDGTSSASPVVANRVVLNGNTADDVDYCLLVTVYVKDAVMNNNVCHKASIAAVQKVDHLTANGNVVDGAHTHGLVENADCMFFEGPTQFVIEGNVLSGCSNSGIYLNGSQLSDASAVTVQLPILDGLVANNQITDVGGACILLLGQSFDHSLTGQHIKSSGNQCVRATTGYAWGAAKYIESTNDSANEIQTNGAVCSEVQEFISDGFKVRNVSKLSPNSYFGIQINGTSTTNGDIRNSVILDENGYMRFGIKDDTLAASQPSNICHWNNSIRGGANPSQPYFPAPAVPTIGAWKAGCMIENFPSRPVTPSAGYRP
jgi:hypothetical protein